MNQVHIAAVYFLLLLSFAGCASFQNQDKEAAQLHLKIGTSYLIKGEYPQALSELLQAEELDDEDPLIQNNLGLAYFVRDKFDLAEKHIRKAIKLKSDYSDAKNNLARVLIEKNQLEEATKLLEVVINDLTYISPEKPLINMGIVNFKQRKFPLAKKYFSKAIEIQRDNCVAHTYYGRTFYEMEDYRRATDALDRAVGFCKKIQFDEPQYYSALSYYQLGAKDKAEARLDELLKVYPQGKYLDKSRSMLDLIRR